MKRFFLLLLAALLLAPLCALAVRYPRPNYRKFEKTKQVTKKVPANEATTNLFTYQMISPVPTEVYNRMLGKSFPKGCQFDIKQLTYLTFKHYGFDGKVYTGEMVVNKAIAKPVLKIFRKLFEQKYQIEKIKLIDDFGANDANSMKANNTSCFCYRKIAGSDKLSKHSLGLAIDINPLYNPCVSLIDGVISKVEPIEGKPFMVRDNRDPRRIKKGDVVYKAFTENGFVWGGDWENPLDFQHFEYKVNLE